MNLLLKLGLRNVKRNPRRSVLTILIICIGVVSLMFTHAIILGMKDSMRQNATSTFLGHAQSHHKDFQNDFSIEQTVPEIRSIVEILEQAPSIRSFSKRVVARGMISSSYHATGVQIFGVDFAKERHVSIIEKAIVAGEYPKVPKDNSILLGVDLADRLDVTLGDKVVLTLTEAHTGELAQELFRVQGIVNFHSRGIDQGGAFIPLKKSQSLLNLGNEVHEIAFSFNKLDDATNQRLPVWDKLRQKEALSQNWEELMPALKSMFEMTNISISIVAIILFLLICLSILNTMFMSIYDRMYEFGVIKALGTKRWQVSIQIVYECLGLGLLGTSLGLLLGCLAVYYWGIHGISFADTEFNGVSVHEPIRTVFAWKQLTLVPLSVLAMTVISGLYPAFYAGKITPMEGMRQNS
ncbi:MAG: ABC transporter permease [Oligoflexales bacterium]